MIGRAALAIWFDLERRGQEDFDRWYPRQHLPERLSVPGFRRGRRYEAAAGGPAYFTLYELAGPEVAASDAYLERLNNPTDWTRRVLPFFRRMIRNAYRLVAATEADAGERHLLTVRITPHSGQSPAIRAWLAGEGVAAVGALPGVAASAFYETETTATSVVTEERRLVGGEVLPATPFLALLEVADPGAVPALRDWWRTWAPKLAAEVETDLYRLLYGLAWIGR